MAPSTSLQYTKSFRKCCAFITDVLRQSAKLPFSQAQISYYIAHMHNNNLKWSTIATQLSAISHYHKLEGLPDPTATYKTSKLMTGVRKTQNHPPDARQPITRKILLGLIAGLHACTTDRYQQLLYSGLFTMMYYACLRASEVLLTDNTKHMLQLSNLVALPNKSYKLHFTSYKHATSDCGSTIYIISTGKQDCPVHHLSKYLNVRGTNTGPLFMSHGAPVTRHQFNKVLGHCLKYLNIPAANYNTHSFRIGRTTDMAITGIPHATIQLIGRWKSNAYLKYVRPQKITTAPNSDRVA